MTNYSLTNNPEGEKEQFSTGAQRDSQAGKPRYDLIYTHMLKRLAMLLARGAEKYGEDNWKKGQPQDRTYASLFRHLMAWKDNTTPEEDHLAAIIFNAMSLMYVEDKVSSGDLPYELIAKGSASEKEVIQAYAERIIEDILCEAERFKGEGYTDYSQPVYALDIPKHIESEVLDLIQNNELLQVDEENVCGEPMQFVYVLQDFYKDLPE